MALPALPVTWELDGFSFNTGASTDPVTGVGYSAIVKTTRGWRDGAPSRPQLTDRPTSDGAYRSPNYLSPRVIELDGIAQVSSKADRELLGDLLAGLCSGPDSQFDLICGERTRSLRAAVERQGTVSVIDQPDGFTVAFNIQVVANDPRKFSTQVKTDVTAIAQAALNGVEWDGPAVPATGAMWNGPASPVTGLVWQASSGVSGIISLDNAGTASTPAQFTITAPATGTLIMPSITDITNGHIITYGGTLIPGDVLTIDTATGLVLLNGSQNAAPMTSAAFFEIPRRSTIQVQFSANGPADTAQLSAVWSDAF
jgi:hypothetical protein